MYPYSKPPIQIEISSLLSEVFWCKLEEQFANPGLTWAPMGERFDTKDHYRVLIPYSGEVPQYVLDDYSIAMDHLLNEVQGDHDYRVFFEEGYLQIVVSYVSG